MKYIISIIFLFNIGCILGWIIEAIFRKFFSISNKKHKWINPGFLLGPYLPLYGFSLIILYFLSMINFNFIGNIILRFFLLLILMTLILTLIEYITGLIFIKKMKMPLWDYSMFPGNISGIICPQFSFFWFILSSIYYFFLNPLINDLLSYLFENSFSLFLTGFFYGIFFIDLVYSFKLILKTYILAVNHKFFIRMEGYKSFIHNKNIFYIYKKKKNQNKKGELLKIK